MPAIDFDDFYAQACTALELPSVALAPDAIGARAFTVTWSGVEISFTERASTSDPRVSVAVRFGPPPADRPLAVLAHLMGASFLMMAEGGAFVLSPLTQEVYFHRQMRLASCNVAALPNMLDAYARQVHEWRTDYFLDGADAVPAGGLPVGTRV